VKKNLRVPKSGHNGVEKRGERNVSRNEKQKSSNKILQGDRKINEKEEKERKKGKGRKVYNEKKGRSINENKV